MHPSPSLDPADSPRTDTETVLQEGTAVHEEASEAALRGDAARLRRCFNNGFSTLDARVFRGVFLLALQNGDVETFQVILDAGGDINYNMGYSGTPLISALRHNHTPLLGFLFSRGVDPNIGCWGHWLPPLSVAVRYTWDMKWIKLLLEKGARIRNTGALHVAAILGNLDRMQLLLEHGADVNEIPSISVYAYVKYHRGGTPLHWAIAGGRIEAIKLLKHHRPDMSALDNEGCSVRDRLAKVGDQPNFF